MKFLKTKEKFQNKIALGLVILKSRLFWFTFMLKGGDAEQTSCANHNHLI